MLWPIVDHLGTVRDLVKQDAAVATHFVYDAFGAIVSGDTSQTRYLFTSREYDAATGLQYNRARWYDANVGRWISEDPLGFAAGDLNVTRYLGNESVSRTDPSGLEDPGRSIVQRIWDWFTKPVKKKRSGTRPPGKQVPLNPFIGRVTELPDGLRQETARKVIDAANNAADMVETAGDFVGISPIGRLSTGEHLNGDPITNGEAILDGVGLVGGDALIAVGGGFLRRTGRKIPRIASRRPVIRGDVVLHGGRSGQHVKNLVGPRNSVVRGGGNRVFVTNDNGEVILDITRDRVKPVIPGKGFGPKRPPTSEELSWLDQVLGDGS